MRMRICRRRAKPINRTQELERSLYMHQCARVCAKYGRVCAHAHTRVCASALRETITLRAHAGFTTTSVCTQYSRKHTRQREMMMRCSKRSSSTQQRLQVVTHTTHTHTYDH